jgi:hypothetical protein
MRVMEKKEEKSTITLNEAGDEQGGVTTIEESTTTDLPALFTLKMKVTEGYTGNFQMSARVDVVKDKYSADHGKKKIQLRCLNGREVLQDMMMKILDEAPKDLPVYYWQVQIGE